MENNKEVWRSIHWYTEHYQASNMGRVRDFGIYSSKKSIKKNPNLKSKILKPYISKDGYSFYFLRSKDNEYERVLVSEIFTAVFLSKKKCRTIDFIDDNPLDNYFDLKNVDSVSKRYKGVRKQSHCKTFFATITINGKEKYLGSFKTAIKASEAYEAAQIKYGKL